MLLNHNFHRVTQGDFVSHLSLDWSIILVGLRDSLFWVMMGRQTIFFGDDEAMFAVWQDLDRIFRRRRTGTHEKDQYLLLTHIILILLSISHSL
jgi:hypothetical protein